MVSIDLGSALSGYIFPFMLVFCRLGATIMLFPGFGEGFVPQRVRLCLALVITFLMFMPLMGQIPPMPSTVGPLVLLMGKEVLIGLFFGSLLHLLLSTVETAGAIMAIQTGLSNAMIMNPTQASQSALPSALMGIAATTMLFVSGMDHYLLKGMIETYRIFPVQGTLALGDLSNTYARLLSESFRVGVEIGAPFLVVGLMLFAALGMIQRLMPQVQLFMVILPLQIWGGLALFGITMAAMMTVWMQYYDVAIGRFFGQ